MGGDGRLAASFLDAAMRVGRNVLASGGTQAGKTTVLNCLAAAIPGTDRVVSAEEVFELTKQDKTAPKFPTCCVATSPLSGPTPAGWAT